METLIVKPSSKESIKANLRFQVLRSTSDKTRFDSFIYDSYSKAKERIDTLKKIFKGDWKYNITIVE
jgi:hypothetical protein